jgi:hypothetical protein
LVVPLSPIHSFEVEESLGRSADLVEGLAARHSHLGSAVCRRCSVGRRSGDCCSHCHIPQTADAGRSGLPEDAGSGWAEAAAVCSEVVLLGAGEGLTRRVPRGQRPVQVVSMQVQPEKQRSGCSRPGRARRVPAAGLD